MRKATNYKKVFLSVLLLGIFFRLFYLIFPEKNFPDRDWYFFQARLALIKPEIPITGITTSITWLHQGPLWTYFLIPFSVLVDPVLASSVVVYILNVLFILLSYLYSKKYFGQLSGFITLIILSFYPLLFTQSSIPYHTSVIPLFTVIALFQIVNKKVLLAGIFLGFLYQSHLLTFIYWPFILCYLFRKNLSLYKTIIGFIIGSIPFIFAGPVHFFGIFAWLLRYLGGYSASSGLSTAYQYVLILPLTMLLSFLLPKMYFYAICRHHN